MKFSILIPSYKSLFLREAIMSVLDQSFKDLELIIVDDCSPEDLASIVNSFSDSRIQYYRNNQNFGAENVVRNWNRCLEYATGDYVICMGDDDMLAPSCLADYKELIDKYPNLYVYHTRTVLIDENSKVYDIQEQRPEYESGYSLWWHRWDGRNKQYIGDFLFERNYLQSQGGFFFLPYAWASDDITAVRAAIPKGIANHSNPNFLYRNNRYTISMSSNERVKANAALLEKDWYDKLLASHSPDDNNDKLLVYLLKMKIENHFREILYYSLLRDSQHNPLRINYWIRNKEKYHFKYSLIWGTFIKSMGRYVVDKLFLLN